jgi:hypothetical protein
LLISVMEFLNRVKLRIGTHDGLTQADLEIKLNLE